jgi:hypothetical protein
LKSVFADSFYFVALFNRTDKHHERAVVAAQRMRGAVLTSEWVLAEFADAMAASRSRSLAGRFIRELRGDPGVRIVGAGSDHFDRGLTLYEARSDKNWSLTDCITFIIMKDEGIREALTGDRHFEQAGFEAILR